MDMIKLKFLLHIYIKSLNKNPDGKFILVTAINLIPAREAKTITTVGLNNPLNFIEKNHIHLEKTSLDPCFCLKSDTVGGGYTQVVLMDDLNLHFTSDFHAITAAHNLFTAIDR
ncbi:formate-tetrahydrofolate ligase [Bartonella koehlerae C-29]|uniref:Formate-tetrahydrofolate ligase n=1 Tax=Bartonella koehlerae C-29 TaxID=1134510 RepID=A0A067WIX1_9HYPH|nr:formate-tetrahydrofolate ligase [Bartonella koehlerae C-29]